MFWQILRGMVRTTVSINRSFTALGATILVTVAVYDMLKARARRQSSP